MIMTSINAPGHTKKRLSVQIAAVIGTAFLPLSAFAADDSLRNDSSLETITVTGEKLDKSLKDTTAAVTVITEDEFENGKTQTVDELATISPNVITGGFGSISIRGINGTGASVGGYSFITGGRPRISTIVDGISQSWSGYGFTPNKLWDTRQVEVLRGPQSTVQGTNSIGGALVVTTNDPTYQYEASARAGMETYKNGNVKSNLAAMVNAPIIDDELAFRLAVDGIKGEGWMNYDQDTDELDNGPDVDDSENYNIRSKLLWEPASIPGLSAKLTFNHHKYDGEYLNWANDTESGYSTQTMTLKDASDNIRLQDSSVDSIAADINYEIVDGIINATQISYIKTDVYFEQYPRNGVVKSDKEQWTLENRLLFNAPDSDWSGVTGLYLSKNDNKLSATFTTPTFDGNSTVITSALYGEASYKLTDKWTLTGGARLENEDTDRYLLAYSSYTIDKDLSETILLPKASIMYNITPDTTLSASIQRGYNAGGDGISWSSTGFGDYYSYEKETVTAYETSVKSQITKSAELTASLFYNDYSGYQAFLNNEYISNIDDAHTYGLEIESSLWATDNLQLHGSLGLLQSEIDSDDIAQKGNELPSAPNSNIAAGFTQYIGQNLSFGANVTYVGEYYSDLANTDSYKAGDYVTADAQIQYLIGDFIIDGYVKNLANEDIIYYVNNSTRAAVGQTRTFGFNVTYKM
ncbi:TonB-dependent receptor [Vibrio salinus]|uniref:TonB-dependent receptor n=1 Tax=Vibrio salinus TaxID=2899784 RepID=UPI001E2B9D8B|nr:TonB-dependent receptor [Vibrio salinus]MCE0493099.1 TonB-dependent receptor [Vibrio salinus]